MFKLPRLWKFGGLCWASPKRRTTLFILVGLVWGIGLLFWRNDAIALWDQDEAAYAGFALRMTRGSNWLIPEFTWSAVHRKTPLTFWLMALSYRVLSPTEFATRLPGAIAITVAMIALICLGQKLWGWQTSAIAAIICLSSFLLPTFGKIALTDGLLFGLETVAMLCWLRDLFDARWFWRLGQWSAVSLGLLTKGPPILVLVLGSWCILWCLCPASSAGLDPHNSEHTATEGILSGVSRERLGQQQPWLWGAIATIPLGLWVGAIYQTEPTLAGELWHWYVAQRLAGQTVAGQWGPPGYYLAIFAIAFLPWWPWLGHAGRSLWRTPRQHAPLIAWLGAGWFIYEWIPSKLPSYAIGAYPAIALLIAQQVTSALERDRLWRWGWRGWLLGAVLFAIALGVVASELQSSSLAVVAIVWLLGTVGIFGCQKLGSENRKINPFGFTTIQSLLLLSLIWGWVLPSWNEAHSATQRLAQRTEQILPAEAQLLIPQNLDLPSLPFYLELNEQPYQTFSTPQTACQLARSSDWFLITQNLAQYSLPKHQIIAGWFDIFGLEKQVAIAPYPVFCEPAAMSETNPTGVEPPKSGPSPSQAPERAG